MRAGLSGNSQCISQTTFGFNFFRSLYSAVTNIGKYIFAPVCGIGCALLDLYDIYTVATNPHERQRKTKIITSLMSFAGNVIYAAGAIAGFLNPVGLAALAFGSTFPAVLKDSYSTHVSRSEVNAEQKQTHPVANRLENLREESFRHKCGVVYKTTKLIGNGLLFAGFFFPPLTIVGGILVGLATLLESYDQKNNYRFSKAVCHYAKSAWNGICNFCSWVTGSNNNAEPAPAVAVRPALSKTTPSTTTLQKRLGSAPKIESKTSSNVIKEESKVIQRQKSSPTISKPSSDMFAIREITQRRIQSMSYCNKAYEEEKKKIVSPIVLAHSLTSSSRSALCMRPRR